MSALCYSFQESTVVAFVNCLYFCYDKLFIDLEFILKEIDPNSQEKMNTVKSFSYYSSGLITGQRVFFLSSVMSPVCKAFTTKC